VKAGIALNEHTAEDGAVVFRHAAPYRSGPSRDWLKVKNPDSPAMIRARDHLARLGQ
jgi:ATP-dependent DNA ligase